MQLRCGWLHVHQPDRQLRGASLCARPDARTNCCFYQTKKLQPEAQTSCKMEDIYLVCHLPGTWDGEGQAAVAGEPFSDPVIWQHLQDLQHKPPVQGMCELSRSPAEQG